MDRDELVKALQDPKYQDGNLNAKGFIEFYQHECAASAPNSPLLKNKIIAMEELAELAKEISKDIRGKGDLFGLVEEIADVQFGIYLLLVEKGIELSVINNVINVKLDKCLQEIEDTGRHR